MSSRSRSPTTCRVASADRGTRVLTVYGGVGYDHQLDALKTGVDVVVGTPGRLIDLMNRRALDLSHIKVLVLDEADEMLDLGFLPDVERLLAKTPETRQTMLFSATMPGAIVVPGPHPHAAPDEHPRRVRRRRSRPSPRPRSSSTRCTTSTSPRCWPASCRPRTPA